MPPARVLSDLLLEWEERAEQGLPVTPEELCRDCPEQLPEFRRQVGLLQAVAPLLDLEAVLFPTLPGFEILGQIGGGGMGVVYRARDLALDRVVAIKVPHRLVLADSNARKRFEREARVLALLRHPNIVPVHGADLLQGCPYFVMDYIPGGSLAGQAGRFRSDALGAVALVEQVARAVEYAHRHHVLHRDLKPSNILLDEHGQALVVDFGVASLLSAHGGEPGTGSGTGSVAAGDTPVEPRLTHPGTAVGTPSYMAPEQFSAAVGTVGRPADVWALGLILHELLTGRLPPGPEATRKLGPPEPRDRAAARAPGLDRRLAAIIRRCLTPDPAGRFASAGALAEALRRWRQRKQRRLWPRLALTLVPLAVAAALAALPWVRSGAEVAGHRLKLQGISQALERGESVELIPETGPPASFLVRAGKSFTGVGTRPEEAFQVWAFGHALIELHNDPHTERYRFSAEIREERALPDAEVGLYYSYQRPAVVGGKGHFFGYVSFADLGRSAQQARDDQGRAGSRAFHNHCYYLEPGPQPIRWAAFNNSSRWYRPPEVEMNQPGPWRHLAVEVTPELVSVTFDDLEFDPFPQFRVQRWATDLPKLQPSLQGSPVPIGPRGGLGLYVYGCTASFRRCRLEPLGSPEPLSTR